MIQAREGIHGSSHEELVYISASIPLVVDNPSTLPESRPKVDHFCLASATFSAISTAPAAHHQEPAKFQFRGLGSEWGLEFK